MTEKFNESGILHDCPECSDKRYTRADYWQIKQLSDSTVRLANMIGDTPPDELDFPPVCVLCLDTGKVEPYSPCPNPGCDGWVYDYGEAAWCPTCDEMIEVTGCAVHYVSPGRIAMAEKNAEEMFAVLNDESDGDAA